MANETLNEQPEVLFSTPVEDCVAVVVDPNHPRFGKVADISAHDWKDYGNVYVTYGDGTADKLQDGLTSHDPVPQVRILFREDVEAIDTISAHLPAVQDKLRQLVSVNHRRINPEARRQAAKEAFWRLINGGQDGQDSLL